jgi:hypothetical protein
MLLLVRAICGAVFGGIAHAPWQKTGTFYGECSRTNEQVRLSSIARVSPVCMQSIQVAMVRHSLTCTSIRCGELKTCGSLIQR